MRTSPLRTLLLLVPMTGVFAQTPALQMNVIHVCTDGQSFKVFSCNDTTGACLYKTGSSTPFAYGFDVNNDGTLQTPLGAIKKMGS